MRPYGGTERILAELWRRAAIARSPLLIDELDAMCGVRDPSDSSGGNAYLVRMMTDEWIRNLDANPQVPVLATVNDLAVDPAVLRRFTSMPPRRRGPLAWPGASRLELACSAWIPPAGWKPCGGAPSDFDAARRRCRMLGLEDAASLAASIERAREARRGARTSVRRPTSDGTAPLSVAGLPSDRHVHVFVASCTGCARLSGEIGLPLVHVDVATDVAQAVRLLNGPSTAPASGSRTCSSRSASTAAGPIGRCSTYAPGPWPRGQARPPGVRVVEGRIAVVAACRRDAHRPARAAAHRAAAPAAARGHERDGLDGGAQRGLPRLRGASPGTRPTRKRATSAAPAGWTTSTSLDPAERPWRLFWSVVSARLAAIEGAT